MKLLISIDLDIELSSDLAKRLLNVLGNDTIESVLKEKLESSADLWGMSFPHDDDYNDNMSIVELLVLDSVNQKENDSE